jgi:putative redox protein
MRRRRGYRGLGFLGPIQALSRYHRFSKSPIILEVLVVTVKEKTVVTQRLQGRCTSHSRTDVMVRDRSMVIDEPLERGGTNQGFTPTETMMASLIGCTNVITHKVAEKNGVAIKSMNVRLEAEFDRPFTSVTLYIDLETDADTPAVERVKRELSMFCPVSKVFGAAGIALKEVWNVSRPK